MKPWAQIEQDPAFTSAPLPVKREVRRAHLAQLEKSPEFQQLAPTEQAEVRAHVLGGYPTAVQTAGHLIAASLTGELERALLEDDSEGMVQALLDAASAAEKALDVPLKDRKREKFPDLAHFHVDKPLRALLCFIEEGLPEYRAYRKWTERRQLPLRGQLEAALASAREDTGLAPVGHSPADLVPERPAIRTEEDLDRALAQALPGLDPAARRAVAGGRAGGPVAALALEKLQREVPEAALKARIPVSAWPNLDAGVLAAVAGSLRGVGDRLGHEATPTAVRAAVHAATERAYEAAARSVLPLAPNRLSGPPRPLPLDAEAVAEYVLGAAAAGPAAAALAREFPLFHVAALGAADVPLAARGAFDAAVARAARALGLPEGSAVPVAAIASALESGDLGRLPLSGAEQRLLEAAARDQGIPTDALPRLGEDLRFAAEEPAAVAVLSAAAAEASAAFATARARAMREVGKEASKAMAAAQRADEPPQPEETAPPAPGAPPMTAVVGPRPLRQALRARPLDALGLKADGLWADFEPYHVAEAGGQPWREAIAALSQAGLLPPSAAPTDLLDALDREDRGGDDGTR